MERILSQDEVDALLKGISSGDLSTESGKPVSAPAVEPYDLTREDRVVRSKIPFIEVLADRFARQFRQTLTSYLRHIVDITHVSSKVRKFGDFLKILQNPTSIHLFRIEPLRGVALMVMDSNLVFVLIELFMGGSGDGLVKIEGREFTNIETRLIRKVTESLLRDLEKIWRSLDSVTVKFERTESNPKLAAVMSPAEPVVCVEMEVEIEVANGTLLLCCPYSMLEPFRDKLSLGDSGGGAMDATWTDQLRVHLRETPVNICVELGELHKTMRDLMNLQVGNVLTLNRSVGDLLPLKVEGVPKFWCLAGKSSGKRAAKIDRRIDETSLGETA